MTGDSESETNEETVIINRNMRRYYGLNLKVELGEMAELYFNRFGRMLFFVSLCIYLYGDLAIYTAAVSKTLSDISCQQNENDTFDSTTVCWENHTVTKINIYRMYVLVFAAAVCPFAYFNVQKTKYLQMFTTSMRWFAFSVMIALASHRLYVHGQEGFPKVCRHKIIILTLRFSFLRS